MEGLIVVRTSALSLAQTIDFAALDMYVALFVHYTLLHATVVILTRFVVHHSIDKRRERS